MRIFLDSDVLLDVLFKREPHFTQSAKLLDWASLHPGSFFVSWHSLANIHYISKSGAQSFIRELLTFCSIPQVGSAEMLKALDLNFSDLEDAMQTVSAMSAGAQYLVTRNGKHYKKSPIQAISPTALLPKLSSPTLK